MTASHKLIAVGLTIGLVIEICLVAGVISLSFLEAGHRQVATEGLLLTASPVAFVNPTFTPIPTSTATPTPTNTRLPTSTPTRVVLDTATPIQAPTATYTLVLLVTPATPTGTAGDTSSVSSATRTPSPTPTVFYPMKIIESQAHDTGNTFFVVFAQITGNNALLPGYRIVGTHSPTDLAVESEPSCADLCKASGPKTGCEPVCDTQCTPVATTTGAPVQEGNVVFEAFAYETGVWSLVVADPQGNQVSDVFQIEIDFERRQWFYYRFDLQNVTGLAEGD